MGGLYENMSPLYHVVYNLSLLVIPQLVIRMLKKRLPYPSKGPTYFGRLYPSSHNHGSVENGCISNTSFLSFGVIFIGSSGCLNDDKWWWTKFKMPTNPRHIWGMNLNRSDSSISKNILKSNLYEWHLPFWGDTSSSHNTSPRNIEKKSTSKGKDFRRSKTLVANWQIFPSPCPLSSIANSQLAQQFQCWRSQLFFRNNA